MSDSIQTCPQCDAFILSDTFECPECGHSFDENKSLAARQARDNADLKFAELHDPCPKCGEMVRTGLVRCWSCSAFMRADVEQRYKDLTSSPQPIIFSDIPAAERTEFIPARDQIKSTGDNYGGQVFDAEVNDDDDEFTLQESFASPQTTAAAPQTTADQKSTETPKTPTDGPDQPKQKTPNAAAESKDEAAAAASAQSTPQDMNKTPQPFDVDDLFSIAVQEQREVKQRKRNRLAESRRKRMLIPCSCGAWVRVWEDQSGKAVRCRQCKRPIVIPSIKRKQKSSSKKSAAPAITVEWVDDVHFHIVAPTDLVLKPGSLEKTAEPVDLGFHESGLYAIKFPAEKKKSLFGRADAGEVSQMRTECRAHITKTGGFNELPHGELQHVPADSASLIRLVQPVGKVHESMFAGVPVFGAGRIALFIPVNDASGQQAFCSLALSTFRDVATLLEKFFSVVIPASENGIPSADRHDALSCFYSQVRIDSLKDLEYYQNDPGYVLELVGYRCGGCGIAVTESARAKNKLGGANGKSIAKAKCPKCSGKFGNNPLFKISKSPVTDEAGPEVAAAAKMAETPAASEQDSASPSAAEPPQDSK